MAEYRHVPIDTIKINHKPDSGLLAIIDDNSCLARR